MNAPQSVPSSALQPALVVLHTFGKMDRGGAELRTLDLVRHLNRDHIETIFGTLTGEEGALEPEIRAIGASVVPLGLGPRGMLRLWRLLRRQRIDVVHSHVATFSGLILLLARVAGVRGRIAHFRSDADRHGNSTRRRAQRTVMRTLLRLVATDIVAVSPAALEFALLGNTETHARTRVLPSGLETAGFLELIGEDANRLWPVNAGVARVLHVGRSSPEKNRTRAIAVLGALQNLGTSVDLVMLGRMSSEERDQLELDCQSLKDPTAVQFVGERTDAPAWIASADVLLVTSTREGLPGVVLEATALGTPVVGSEIPGISWLEERFASIHSVHLASSDEEWAESLREAVLRRPSAESRKQALSVFEGSPFALPQAVEAFHDLWTVAAGRR